MRVKFNIALRIENDATGEIEENVGADVYLDYSNGESLDYFKEGLMAICNGMSDHILSYNREGTI